jgi:WhiB family redox-sensing transcriptional regulator
MTQGSLVSNFSLPEFLDKGEALCAEVDPELFFPQEVEVVQSKTIPISVYKDLAAAKEICKRCPLAAECLAYALNNQVIGVWGGTTERQRDQLRRRNRAYRAI